MAITLTAYLDGVTAFVGAVPSVKTAIRFTPLLDEQEAPIALVQPVDLTRVKEAGSEGFDSLPMDAEVEVIVLVKSVEREGYVTALEVAYDIAQHIHLSSMGMPVGFAEIESLSVAPLESIGERWDGARLVFHQPLRLVNAQAPVEPPENVTTVHLGMAPKIGAAHQADYTEIKVDG